MITLVAAIERHVTMMERNGGRTRAPVRASVRRLSFRFWKVSSSSRKTYLRDFSLATCCVYEYYSTFRESFSLFFTLLSWFFLVITCNTVDNALLAQMIRYILWTTYSLQLRIKRNCTKRHKMEKRKSWNRTATAELDINPFSSVDTPGNLPPSKSH